MGKERVLITVKTYPTLSRKYGETVCTAGIRGDGSWVRIYPVPFRRLEEEEQYKKFDWIECTLLRNRSDPRPETYRPMDEGELRAVAHVDTADGWRERRRLLLKTARVYDRLDDLIAGAKRNELSLAVYKPARILDFFWEEDSREWDPEKVRQMRELTQQLDLFADNTWRHTFQVIPKLPYSFSYRFDAAQPSTELTTLPLLDVLGEAVAMETDVTFDRSATHQRLSASLQACGYLDDKLMPTDAGMQLLRIAGETLAADRCVAATVSQTSDEPDHDGWGQPRPTGK